MMRILVKTIPPKVRIILVFFLIIFSVPLRAQNCGPVRRQFKFNDTLRYLDASLPYFTQNKFMLGWHWGSARKLSDALLCSQEHTNPAWWLAVPDTLKDSVDLIVTYDELVSADNIPGCFFRDQGIQYEATNLISNDTLVQADVPHVNPNDATNTVFGFREIKGTMTNRGTLLLTSDQFQQTVLSKPWPDYGLYFKDNPDIEKTADGSCWYFQINLKFSGSSKLPADSPILKIRLPYTCQDKKYSGYIKFSHLPCPTHGNRDSNYLPCDTSGHSNRGKYLIMQPSYDNLPEITITRGMMPVDSNFVTIEAVFYCDNKVYKAADTNSKNPIMSGFEGYFSEGAEYRIKNLDIDVTYLDNEINDSLEIDWVRICTPETRNLLFGSRDSSIVFAVQGALDAASTDSLKRKGIRPFRIYLRDEPGLSNFLGFKYFGDLVGNIFTTAQGMMFPRLFAAYTNAPEVWIEEDNINFNIAAPYFKTTYVVDQVNDWLGNSIGSNRWKTLNLRNPYNRMCYPLSGKDSNALAEYYDPTHSEYETSTRGGIYDTLKEPGISALKTMPEAEYKLYLQARYGFLSRWEWITYRLAHGGRHKNFFRCGSGFMFENRPWWGEVFVGSRFFTQKKENNGGILMCMDLRPKTGEEIRLATGLLTILGAKGLLYDKDAMNAEKLWTGLAFNQEDMRDNISASSNEDFIFSPKAGCDFIDSNFVYYDFYVNAGLHVNSTSKAMAGISDDDNSTIYGQNRIYIGMRSPRTEIYKLHKAIRRIEEDHITEPGKYPSDLMNLRLIAWHAKGFKAWDAPRSEEEFGYSGAYVLRKFFDIDGIKTARLFNVSKNDDYTLNYSNERDSFNLIDWEALGTQDSSFYDLTLLADSVNYRHILHPESRLTDLQFYFGIQNRRTDPLIRQKNGDIHFYSTAELSDICRSNNDADTLWWKQFGTRVLRLPLHLPDSTAFKPAAHNLPVAFFTVEEILAQDIEFNAKNWWRDISYCDLPAYYFSYSDSALTDKNIDVKLLPGEAKVFKCGCFSPYYFKECPGRASIFIKNRDAVQIDQNRVLYSMYIVNNTDSAISNLPVIVTNPINEGIVLNSTGNSSVYKNPESNTASVLVIAHSIPAQSEALAATVDVPINAIPYLDLKLLLFDDDGICSPDSVAWENNVPLRVGNSSNIIINIANPTGEFSYEIQDSAGRVVFQKTNSKINSGETSLPIDAKQLSDGGYRLILHNKNNSYISNFEIKKGEIK